LTLRAVSGEIAPSCRLVAGNGHLRRKEVMMAKKVKFGVIGLGWPGSTHIRAIFENRSKAELVAVADILPERRKDLVERLEKEKGVVPREYDDIKGLLSDPEVEAICIGLPNYLHAPVALAALRKGVHVFTEKPPTMKAAEMKRIVREVDKTGLTYMYVCQRRYSSQGMAFRRMVERGTLGEVYHARAVWRRARGIPIGAGGWFVDKKRAGGGALIDIGVHMLDAAWYFMGSPKPVSISGSVYTKFKNLIPPKVHYDVDDLGVGLIKFANGASLFLEASWALNQREDEYHSVTLFGTKAGAEFSPMLLLKRDKKRKLVEKPIPYRKTKRSDFGNMIAHFVDCIESRKEPVTSAKQALQLMQMLDGVYQSSETGREVRIK
jgi:predicted dehydrogenase